MTQGKNNTPNNGRNGLRPAKPFILGSPATKTESAKSTEATSLPTNPSANGSAARKTSSAHANANSSNAMPVPKLPKTTDRAAEALKRLKIKPEALATAPQITELFRGAEGGLKLVLRAMRFWTHDEVIAAFLKKYDTMPEGDRAHLPWEAIGLAAKLDIRTLSGAIMNAIVQFTGNDSKILALTSHRKVLASSIRYAQKPSGDKDRRDVHLMVGALPSPKGPTFIGKAVFGGSKNNDDAEPGKVFTEDDDPNAIFPDASSMQERLIPIRQRRLPG